MEGRRKGGPGGGGRQARTEVIKGRKECEERGGGEERGEGRKATGVKGRKKGGL